MTASPAASNPASGIHAATCPGLWPGVGTISAVRPPSSTRVSSAASAPANGSPARLRARSARRLAERHVVALGEARVALADHALRVADEREVEAAGEHARVRALAASSSAVPPRWSLSGCVMSTTSSRRPSRATSGSSSVGRDSGQARVDEQHRLVAGDRDLAHDARAVVLLAAPDPVGQLAGSCGRLHGVEQAVRRRRRYRSPARRRAAAAAGRDARDRPGRTSRARRTETPSA